MKKGTRKLPDDIKEVFLLVRAGKLFAVQDWIRSGKRLRPAISGKSDSIVLRTAVETGFHSMVEELLKAGGWPSNDLSEALSLARECRQFDIAALLAGKGAQPKQATFRTACEKLDLFMMERLLRSGADPAEENVFAEMLTHKKARPLLRFYRQFRCEFPDLEGQAALALAEAVRNRQVRWAALLAWAGADPFRPVPYDLSGPVVVDPDDSTTAAREALWQSSRDILKVLHLKPTADQALDLIASSSCHDDPKLFQSILNAIPPERINDSKRNSSTALESLAGRRPYRSVFAAPEPTKGNAGSLQCLELLLNKGARWNPPPQELRYTRQALLKHDPRYVVQVLRLLLYTPNAADLGGFLEICRSSKLMDNIVAVDAPLAQDIKGLRRTHPVNTVCGAEAKTETAPAGSVAPARQAAPLA